MITRNPTKSCQPRISDTKTNTLSTFNRYNHGISLVPLVTPYHCHFFGWLLLYYIIEDVLNRDRMTTPLQGILLHPDNSYIPLHVIPMYTNTFFTSCGDTCGIQPSSPGPALPTLAATLQGSGWRHIWRCRSVTVVLDRGRLCWAQCVVDGLPKTLVATYVCCFI
jgi:hypothetical protein